VLDPPVNMAAVFRRSSGVRGSPGPRWDGAGMSCWGGGQSRVERRPREERSRAGTAACSVRGGPPSPTPGHRPGLGFSPCFRASARANAAASSLQSCFFLGREHPEISPLPIVNPALSYAGVGTATLFLQDWCSNSSKKLFPISPCIHSPGRNHQSMRRYGTMCTTKVSEST
jgi:hypothetical protein